ALGKYVGLIFIVQKEVIKMRKRVTVDCHPLMTIKDNKPTSLKLSEAV
ncbi:MAG: hypothetical protein ACI96W_002894, partial [Paraglaciecola sp.]